MFFTDAILSRRGPLARVWLAAHMERKLSKTQTLQTDIAESVGAIMGQEVEVMALRLSGQLLLGVVRIYSRKAKYLLDDCNEALLKIKMAFRPGMVDMTEDQLVVNRNAITLQPSGVDLDLIIPDLNWDFDLTIERPVARRGQHLARQADITLANTVDLDMNLNATSDFDLGPSDGIGSQDFDVDFDLGITWGDEPNEESVHENDDSMSIEVGLDAPAPRHSLDPNIFGQGDMDMDLISNRSKSRAGSQHPFGGDDMDFGDLGAGVDLAEMGIGFDDIDPPPPASDPPEVPEDREKTPGATRESSRASSPLTELPQTPPPEAALNAEEAAIKPKRKPREKKQKQIIDSVTELADGPGARIGRGRKSTAGLGAPMTKDVSNILTEPRFLPRSSVVTRLLEIRDDPVAHFLPTKVTPSGTYVCFAPPGLPPQLAGMFMHPAAGPSKKRAASPGKAAQKKRRVDEDEEIEQARRAGSAAPSVVAGTEILGGRDSIGPISAFDLGGDNTLGFDDFQMDIGPEDVGGGGAMSVQERARSRSRMSTPGAEPAFEEGPDSYADAACPIVEFDLRPTQTQTQDSSSTGVEPVVVEHDSKGYSKNTVTAIRVIRRQLKPKADDVEGEDKFMSFKMMSNKASRRAASSFFFELLVLATRDCVHVSQAAPFENIEVRAKDKLWEHQAEPLLPASSSGGGHGGGIASRFGSLAPGASRHGSVAPSRHDSVPPVNNMRASVARSIGSTLGL